MLAGHTLGLENGFDFTAGVPNKKFVEHALFGKVKTARQKLSIHAGLRRSGSRPNPLSNLKNPAE
ncbi:protein of unknown function [Ruminococcaceae bacterium BL-4]|nr:protein of unknown function [Ruminococcaceae bacterium BL-4]